MAALLSQVSQEYSDTVIITNHDKKIFALSDIHADIHVLLIALRDLAGVIRKKNGFGFNPDEYDQDLEILLLLDLNINEEQYVDDLNYEWITGNDSFIVIVGDIIDGNRNFETYSVNKMVNGTKMLEHQYPQIEIKILRFINALNKQAIINRGRIFKLFGNHEIMNILPRLTNSYIFESDSTDIYTGQTPSYYGGETRLITFNRHNQGFKYLLEDGCWCLLIINNYIFVHGEIIGHTLSNYEYCNNILNSNTSPREKFYEVLNYLNNDNGILWQRTFGSPNYINIRMDNPKESRDFCKLVDGKFKSLLQDRTFMTSEGKELSIDNFKVVIGHCQQHVSTLENKKNMTFTTKIHSDKIKEIYGAPAEIGSLYSVDKSNPTELSFDDKFIFGISMECPHEINNNEPRIYKVDVGSSRSFDSVIDFTGIITPRTREFPSDLLYNEKKIFFSRTPQILFIQSSNKESPEQIIKSRMRNTRIHQPRHLYEKIIEHSINPSQLSFIKSELESNNDLNRDKLQDIYDKNTIALKKLYDKHKKELEIQKKFASDFGFGNLEIYEEKEVVEPQFDPSLGIINSKKELDIESNNYKRKYIKYKKKYADLKKLHNL